eukprot:scaffold23786_cov129-Isochrysis_galbana.AAC.2
MVWRGWLVVCRALSTQFHTMYTPYCFCTTHYPHTRSGPRSRKHSAADLDAGRYTAARRSCEVVVRSNDACLWPSPSA